MSVLRVRGRALPDGEPVDLYADGDRWTIEPAAGAELVAEGWLIPGLVDAHTHPGAEKPGQPLDEALLRDDLHEHVAAGVTMIRSPGLAADPPAWFGRDSDVPRAVHAGPWIAQVGQFFDGWARRASHAELPALAAAQAQRTGWAKLIGDWSVSDEPIPVDVLAAVVAAVHAVGGRVAVHAQHPGGSAPRSRRRSTRWSTACGWIRRCCRRWPRRARRSPRHSSAIVDDLPKAASAPEGPRKDWYVGGASVHAELTAAAAEAGVTILAGTDSRPHGRVASEIRALAAAGVPAHDALAAGSWAARAYLGLPGLAEGAPADAVVYDSDPRADLGQLDHPRAVILRGQPIRRASQ